MGSHVIPRDPTGPRGMPRNPTALSHGIPRDAVAFQMRSRLFSRDPAGSRRNSTDTPRGARGASQEIFHRIPRASSGCRGMPRDPKARYAPHDNPRDFSRKPAASHGVPRDARCGIACSGDIPPDFSPWGSPKGVLVGNSHDKCHGYPR